MNNLRFLRKELNFNVEKVVDNFSFGPSTLNQYETGYRSPNPENIKLLADYFMVTLDYLLNYSKFGLYVINKETGIKSILFEDDYIKYRDLGLIEYKENIRYINIDNEAFDNFKISVKSERVNAIKKLNNITEEKFKIIEDMLNLF